MTEVSFRITHPSTGELLKGRITLTPRHTRPGRPITDSGAVVSGSPIVVELSGEPVTIDLRGSGPDWRYDVVGQDESGWRFSESVRVPMRLPDGTESIDYGNLERVDPRAGGIPFTPDPAWWAVAREVQSLGGIPGESFKAAMERHYQRSLTDAELANLMRGAKGDPGDPGRDGETYLDYFRQEVEDPSATREDYHEWIRGRDAVEQWATFVGLHPDDVTVEDMLEAQRGKDAFVEWRERNDLPDATWDDFMGFLTGPQGEDSLVPGPRGEHGKSAYDAVVASGYEGSEDDFAGKLLGEPLGWVEATPLAGGNGHPLEPLLVRLEDGIIRIIGLIQLSDASRPLVRLPEGCRPDKNYVVHAGSNRSDGQALRLWVNSNGEIVVHAAEQGNAPTLAYLRTELPAANGASRPRIPGPAGKSAMDFALDAGWEGDREDFADRMRRLAEFSGHQWDTLLDRIEREIDPIEAASISRINVTTNAEILPKPGELLIRDDGVTRFTDFTSEVVGPVSGSDQWDIMWDEAGWSFAEAAGASGGIVVRKAPTSSNISFASLKWTATEELAASYATQEIVFKWRRRSGNNPQTRGFLHGSGDTSEAATGYVYGRANGSVAHFIGSYHEGHADWTTHGSFPRVDDRWHISRLRVDADLGSFLGRSWLADDPEPHQWDAAMALNPDIAPGGVGIVGSGGALLDVDWFGAAFGGGRAPRGQ